MNKTNLVFDFSNMAMRALFTCSYANAGAVTTFDTDVKIVLKDVTKANKDGIQKMGAQGIVEIDNQLKIILGVDAKQIKKYINELK